MSWYGVYRTDTGALVSVTDDLPSPLPAGHDSVVLEKQPDGTLEWDPAAKAMVARAAVTLVDRLQDVIANPAYSDFLTAYNTLNATQKTNLRQGLARLLGSRRYRTPGEPVVID